MSIATFSPRCVFLTGANRGIGLELVKQFLLLSNPPSCLVTTYRDPANSQELQDLAANNSNVHTLKCDVTDYSSLPGTMEQVSSLTDDAAINLIINNSGFMSLDRENTINDVTPENLRKSFEVNTIAPMMLTKACLPMLKKAVATSGDTGLSCSKAAIINISSKMASFTDNGSGKLYPYRISKVALNMVTKNCAVELKSDGILAAVLHPGWVQTDMGGPNALIKTKQSAQGMLSVMASLTDKDTGCFYDYKGEEIPW